MKIRSLQRYSTARPIPRHDALAGVFFICLFIPQQRPGDEKGDAQPEEKSFHAEAISGFGATSIPVNPKHLAPLEFTSEVLKVVIEDTKPVD